MIEALLVIAAVAAVARIVLWPLRGGVAERVEGRSALRAAELEAAKESKYREIREAELDFRTGKLSEADWRATDRELRAEAVAILRELDGYHAEP